MSLTEYEDDFVKLDDMLRTLHLCLQHCRSINSEHYYLDTLSATIVEEYNRLLEKLLS